VHDKEQQKPITKRRRKEVTLGKEIQRTLRRENAARKDGGLEGETTGGEGDC